MTVIVCLCSVLICSVFILSHVSSRGSHHIPSVVWDAEIRNALNARSGCWPFSLPFSKISLAARPGGEVSWSEAGEWALLAIWC